MIILSDPTYNGIDPVTGQIRNITSRSCEIRIKEPNYKDGRHKFETISYIIGEKGSYQIGNKTIEFV